MHNIKLNEALKLGVSFGLLGLIFSTKKWIRYINGLSPTNGLIIYYIIIYITIFILAQFGLVIGHTKITNYTHTLGVVMILFAFFIVFDWESEYINVITKGDFDKNKISNIYLQSEDGAVFDIFYRLTNNLEKSRILTFIVTPFLLALTGSFLIENKVKLGW